MKKSLLFLLLFTSYLFAQKGDYGLTIKGGLNFPIGDFNNYYNASLGGFGGAFYNFSETGRVSFTIGYNSWPIDLDALNEDLKNSGNTGRYNIEAPINAIPILINVKFFLKTELSFTPYFQLEGGVYNITREVYGKYINLEGVAQSITSRNENTTDGSISLGFGAEYPINEIINFDISTRYHLILYKYLHSIAGGGYETNSNTNNFISLSAGLNIFFR